jgi:hypothetical protein
MANPTVALCTVQVSRSKATFEALIERWAGILVSDGYGVYQHWRHGRQTCLAHLIRRARGLSERKEPGVGVVWTPSEDRVATAGFLGHGTTDQRRGPNLVRAHEASDCSVSAAAG